MVVLAPRRRGRRGDGVLETCQCASGGAFGALCCWLRAGAVLPVSRLQRQRNDQSPPGALRATGTRRRAGFAPTRVEQKARAGRGGSSQHTDEYANFALGGAVHRLTASVGRQLVPKSAKKKAGVTNTRKTAVEGHLHLGQIGHKTQQRRKAGRADGRGSHRQRIQHSRSNGGRRHARTRPFG